MTDQFSAWLLARMDELDRLYDIPDPDENVWLRCAAIAHEAGDMAARCGLPMLHKGSRHFGGYAEPPHVKTYLAECLAAVRDIPNGEPPAMMTEAETISYLRLDVDTRDPAERLRNLVRRQRLPSVRRGRLLLFRRAAVDAWLDRRK